MNTVTEEPKCSACNVNTGFQHSPYCQHASLEEVQRSLKYWAEECQRHQRQAQQQWERVRGYSTKWRGKFLEVKEENNALRKANAWLRRDIEITTAERDDARLTKIDPKALADRLDALADGMVIRDVYEVPALRQIAAELRL